jgi:hypothetical protein
MTVELTAEHPSGHTMIIESESDENGPPAATAVA